MDDRSHRQRMFRLHREWAQRSGVPITELSFGWVREDDVVARVKMSSRRSEYRTFPVGPDDEPLLDALVAWVHALRPSTS